jgi:putative sigma-54 modulation protein
MNIAITFRNLDSTEAVKQYATEKIAKLQRFLRQPMHAHVTLSVAHHVEHMIEVRVSSGSEHFEGHEQSDDMYASIDKVVDKLERQISGAKGAVVAKRRGSTSARMVAAANVMPEALMTAEVEPEE